MREDPGDTHHQHYSLATSTDDIIIVEVFLTKN